jgi:DNA primase
VTRYTDDSREHVRDAVDMVALVSARTELRRAGVNSYFGICPFHDERTGSFHVSPDERLYHCFGCQASGDAFKFVMETEGVDFSGALETLGERPSITPDICGRRARPRRRASTWPVAGCARRPCASSASAMPRARGTG